ncbi:hypothetical protein M514_06782 [Trichuris suis]|uniref:Uncharacterized protein n=1 Tax=Trichuris suis TaxID=68888 RepID=A0A085NKI4_9BILA|nr:hypothetical protein M514_06782 [Trichuris suis]
MNTSNSHLVHFILRILVFRGFYSAVWIVLQSATDQCFARPLFLQFTAKLFKQACRSFFFRFSTNLWLNEGLRMGSLLHWVCCHFAPKSAFEYGIPEHNKSAVFTFFKEAFDKADR